MKKNSQYANKFTPDQINQVLDAVESGEKVADVCKRFGCSVPSYYVWKRQAAGGRGVADKKVIGQKTGSGNSRPNEGSQIERLTKENAMLKQLVANQALEILSLKEMTT